MLSLALRSLLSGGRLLVLICLRLKRGHFDGTLHLAAVAANRSLAGCSVVNKVDRDSFAIKCAIFIILSWSLFRLLFTVTYDIFIFEVVLLFFLDIRGGMHRLLFFHINRLRLFGTYTLVIN